MNPRIQAEAFDLLGPAISMGTIHKGDPGPFSAPKPAETDFARRMREDGKTIPDGYEQALEHVYDWGRQDQRREHEANADPGKRPPASLALARR